MHAAACYDSSLVLSAVVMYLYVSPGAAETESVFQGYVSRDRRKPHVAEADRAADRLLRRARAAGEGLQQPYMLYTPHG